MTDVDNKNNVSPSLPPRYQMDFRTQKEVMFQTLQTLFHVMISSLVAYGTPSKYWDHYTDQFFKPAQGNTPWGVILPYTLSTSYHCILYFWDPISNTPLRARHIITVMFGTILLSYGHLGWGLQVMFCNYIFDMRDFIKHRIKAVDDSRVIVMMMMKIHHMVTLALLGISWIYGFTAYGLLVLFIHDVTDVPMFVVRILRRKHAPQSVVVPVAVGVIAIWLYYRVFCFGLIIYNGFDIFWYMFRNAHENPEFALVVETHMTGGICCLSGLTLLWAFNVYWTFLVIYKALREILFGKEMSIRNE